LQYITGYTNCYIQDHPFYHVCSIPIEVAVEWVKKICPDVNMGFGFAAKDLTINENEDTDVIPNGWLNKLFIVVSNDHGHSFALVNWDGRFAIYKKRFEDN